MDIASTNQAIAGFYDEFSQYLMNCYVNGNPRVTQAVNYAIQQIPKGAAKVLEVGCGIGETTSRLRAARPDVTATGIDISSQNIANAQRLFGDQAGLSFAVCDMTTPVPGGPFDMVTLLDVYEHIPVAVRPSFHRSLRSSMADHARLVLTCPSIWHQQYLQENHPEGLQIIDESIGPAQLLQLANDLQGHLVDFSYSSVWRSNDYFHATIDLQVAYAKLPKPTGIKKWIHKWQKKIDHSPLGAKSQRLKLLQAKFPNAA